MKSDTETKVYRTILQDTRSKKHIAELEKRIKLGIGDSIIKNKKKWVIISEEKMNVTGAYPDTKREEEEDKKLGVKRPEKPGHCRYRMKMYESIYVIAEEGSPKINLKRFTRDFKTIDLDEEDKIEQEAELKRSEEEKKDKPSGLPPMAPTEGVL